MTSLTILGGGPAGLGLAFYAHRAGMPFVLVEASSELGGMCRTFRSGEHLYDCGAHRFHDRDPEITKDVLALGGAQPGKSVGSAALRPLLDGLQRAPQQRLELGGRLSHRENVVPRQGAAFRKFLVPRHQGVEHQGQQVALCPQSPSPHERLRMIPSAM